MYPSADHEFWTVFLPGKRRLGPGKIGIEIEIGIQIDPDTEPAVAKPDSFANRSGPDLGI